MENEGFLFSFAFSELAQSIYPAQFHAVYEIGMDITKEDILDIFPTATQIHIVRPVISLRVNGIKIELFLNRSSANLITSTGKKVILRRKSNGSYEFNDDDDDTCFLFYILERDGEYYDGDISFSRGDLEFTEDDVSSIDDIEDMIQELEAEMEEISYESDPIDYEEKEVEVIGDDIVEETVTSLIDDVTYAPDPVEYEDNTDVAPSQEETTVETPEPVQETDDSFVESDTSY